MGKRSVLLLLLLAAAASRAGAEQAEGKVVEVRGDKVRIALATGGAARIGQQVEIQSPDARLAGFWLVMETRGIDVTAVKVEALLTPQAGWKAIVYDADAIQADVPPPPWQRGEPAAAPSGGSSQAAQPAADPFVPFGPPPPGAFVSTKGYALKRDDGTWQEGFENFRRWAAARGPGRDKMVQAYRQWRSGTGAEPFLGLWVEKNRSVVSQVYAMAPVGLIVTGVCPGAAADRAGLRAGDFILKVGGEFVKDPMVLSEADGPLALEVERDSKTLEITLEAERHE